MQKGFLQRKRVLRTALLVLLLGTAGMGKGYAYDFSAVCPSGQTLYYNIINATCVELTCPGTYSWGDFEKPSGNIILPESVQYEGSNYNVAVIGEYAFIYCPDLISISIPQSVTTIGDGAFNSCTGLTNLDIPQSVTTIGEGAFNFCTSLASLYIPQSVTTIGTTTSQLGGGAAFVGCTGLEQISVDENNPVFDSRDNCNAIIETNTNTLRQGCKSTTIPGNITTIGYAAFMSCTDLTSIVIPNSVTAIGTYSFCSSGLTTISIPSSVTEIGFYAFYLCTGLTSVNILATTPPTLGNSFGYDVFSEVPCTTLTVPCNCIPVYQASDWHEHFTTIVQDCTGVSEEEESAVFIYPNPIMGQMRIEAEGLKQIAISNALGQVIFEGKAEGEVFEYDFGRHEEGLYFVRIETANGTTTKRVVVTQ